MQDNLYLPITTNQWGELSGKQWQQNFELCNAENKQLQMQNVLKAGGICIVFDIWYTDRGHSKSVKISS